MVVGLCTIRLSLPAARSLKDKRGVLKSMLARVRREFNVSVAEVGENDLWHSATVAVACVSTDPGYAHGLLTRVVQTMDQGHWELELLDYEMEML
jgi:uncharacterized protein YlxP (DUF503 family)